MKTDPFTAISYFAATLCIIRWVRDSGCPDDAFTIVGLLLVCAMPIKTLWRLEKLKETLHESKKRLEKEGKV